MQRDAPRKLAAILAADIVGYSRLMGSDETGTHIRVRQIMHEFVEPTIAEHRGHLVKMTGDGFLAVFDSPVEAVRCAIVIQQIMVGHNLEVPKARWIQFRVGVNLGDIIVEGQDIYGEGVNIAARLEQMADPGNVYISGAIYEQIKHKIVCAYQSLGDRKVKNITDPVPVYKVLPDPAAVERARSRHRWLNRALFAGVLLICAASGGVYLLQAKRAPTGANSLLEPKSMPASTAELAPRPGEPLAAPPAQTPAGPPKPAQGEAASPPPPAGTVQTPDEQLAMSGHVGPGPGDSPGRESAEQVALPAKPANRPSARPKEPEMVLLPGGRFEMGSNEDPSEKPIHSVNVRPFWIAKYPVTIREWRDCVAAAACNYAPAGEDDRPVSNVSWNDAAEFLSWLSGRAGKKYRLPTEAEWEYAARAGSRTKYWWGNEIGVARANCRGCGGPYDPHQPMMVGGFPANPFGLYEMAGGVAEWVSDCWHKDYRGAPKDGSSWETPDCTDRVLRGGSWRDSPVALRVSDREHYEAAVRYPTHGFRVARTE